MPVAHVDLFRLESLEGEDPALLDDYLDGGARSRSWSGRGAALPWLELERVALRVELAHAAGTGARLRAAGSAGAPCWTRCVAA